MPNTDPAEPSPEPSPPAKVPKATIPMIEVTRDFRDRVNAKRTKDKLTWKQLIHLVYETWLGGKAPVDLDQFVLSSSPELVDRLEAARGDQRMTDFIGELLEAAEGSSIHEAKELFGPGSNVAKLAALQRLEGPGLTGSEEADLSPVGLLLGAKRTVSGDLYDRIDAARGETWSRIDAARGDTDFDDFVIVLLEAYKDSISAAIMEAAHGRAHRIWWITESMRRLAAFRLPPEAPEYLKNALQLVQDSRTRPRGRIEDLTGDLTPADLPALEVLQGSSPLAKWLWSEAVAGILVRAADLVHLGTLGKGVPGVVTTFGPVQRPFAKEGKTIVEIGL